MLIQSTFNDSERSERHTAAARVVSSNDNTRTGGSWSRDLPGDQYTGSDASCFFYRPFHGAFDGKKRLLNLPLCEI